MHLFSNADFLGLTIVLHGETKEVTGGIFLILQDIADLKIIHVSWKHRKTQNCKIKPHKYNVLFIQKKIDQNNL